jgi:hypothetical protein
VRISDFSDRGDRRFSVEFDANTARSQLHPEELTAAYKDSPSLENKLTIRPEPKERFLTPETLNALQ